MFIGCIRSFLCFQKDCLSTDYQYPETIKTTNITALFGALILIFGTAFSQGEALFKQKCNTCHMVDKESTGPWLKGVKQKWADAGEAELLYKWVVNPPALIASGQSKMALAVRGFNPNEMPPQTVTNDEVDAILAYVDGYIPIVDTTGIIHGETPGGISDYEENLILFYWLFGLMIFLILVIIVMSNTIISFLHSDFFKNGLKVRRNNNVVLSTLLLVLVFGTMLFNNTSYALSCIAAETTENTPWLLVERFDIYLMLAIDIVLVFVVLYLRGLFTTFLQLVSNKTFQGNSEFIR
ncbi:MAG: c-type cytochrome [Bacteroidota bacterium]